MEDSVVVWGFIVIVVYGAAIRWFIKGLKAERKAKRENIGVIGNYMCAIAIIIAIAHFYFNKHFSDLKR